MTFFVSNDIPLFILRYRNAELWGMKIDYVDVEEHVLELGKLKWQPTNVLPIHRLNDSNDRLSEPAPVSRIDCC